MIDALILTKNEDIHLDRCLNNISKLTNSIYILDSYSNDNTIKIANKYKAKIYYRKFDNYSFQFNWALNNIKFINNWVIRIDADEFLSDELIAEINKQILNVSSDINGFNLKRVIHFLGKKILYGGYFPTFILRVWRVNTVFCSNDLVDEQLILKKGKSINLSSLLIEKNNKGLYFWLKKHIKYADFESSNYHNYLKTKKIQTSSNLKHKKYFIYYNFLIFIRPFIYFIYRIILKKGYLDGLKGILFHFLQSFLYRLYVDILIFYKYLKKIK